MANREEELLKLTATFLNNIAVGVVVAGAIAPIAAYIFNGPSRLRLDEVLILGVMTFALGFGLHLVARRVLGRIAP